MVHHLCRQIECISAMLRYLVGRLSAKGNNSRATSFQFTVASLMCLIVLPQVRPDCIYPIRSQAAPGNVYNYGSLYIEDSFVTVKWNFLSVYSRVSTFFRIYFAYTCNNTTPAFEVLKLNAFPNFASSFGILNLMNATLQTTCSVCWYYQLTIGSNQSGTYILNPLIFSFEAYCVNKTYNISSNFQFFTIPSNSVACFICYLPGGATPDTWIYKGSIINQTYLEGSLLLENTSLLFTDSITDSILTCIDSASMNLLKANVTLKDSVQMSSSSTGIISDSTHISSTSTAIISDSVSTSTRIMAESVLISPESVLISPSKTYVRLDEMMTTFGALNTATFASQDSASTSTRIIADEMMTTFDPLTKATFASQGVQTTIIGTTSSVVFVFIAAAPVVLLAIIWVSKRKKDIDNVDLNTVIKEHSAFAEELKSSISVATELDHLEWEKPTSNDVIKSLPPSLPSFSDSNGTSSGRYLFSAPSGPSHGKVHCGYIEMHENTIHCSSENDIHVPCIEQAWQHNVDNILLQNETSELNGTICSTKCRDAGNLEYIQMNQGKMAEKLKCQNAVVIDEPQAPYISYAVEYPLFPVEGHVDKCYGASNDVCLDRTSSVSVNVFEDYVDS